MYDRIVRIYNRHFYGTITLHPTTIYRMSSFFKRITNDQTQYWIQDWPLCTERRNWELANISTEESMGSFFLLQTYLFSPIIHCSRKSFNSYELFHLFSGAKAWNQEQEIEVIISNIIFLYFISHHSDISLPPNYRQPFQAALSSHKTSDWPYGNYRNEHLPSG